MRIKINAESMESGEESVMLSLVGDKARFNYLFVLQQDGAY